MPLYLVLIILQAQGRQLCQCKKGEASPVYCTYVHLIFRYKFIHIHHISVCGFDGIEFYSMTRSILYKIIPPFLFFWGGGCKILKIYVVTLAIQDQFLCVCVQIPLENSPFIDLVIWCHLH